MLFALFTITRSIMENLKSLTKLFYAPNMPFLMQICISKRLSEKGSRCSNVFNLKKFFTTYQTAIMLHLTRVTAKLFLFKVSLILSLIFTYFFHFINAYML